MAFTWPGKKEVREPVAKAEFPAALEADIAEVPASKGENPLRVAAREAPTRPPAGEADALAALTERLEDLGKLLDGTKEQVTSYLLHRESQLAGGDQGKSTDEKFDGLLDKMVSYGLVLDAIHRKVEQLVSAGPRSAPAVAGGEGGGPSVSEAALKSVVRPVGEKLEQVEGKLKSIDALKDALVSAITKLRDAHAEQHNTLGAGIRQLGEMVPQYFNALPQYFTAIQQHVVAAQQHADAGLRAISKSFVLRHPQAGPRRRLPPNRPSAAIGKRPSWAVSWPTIRP